MIVYLFNDVSKIGLGLNGFGTRVSSAVALEIIDSALANGVNFFDTADIYGDGKAEELLGTALRSCRDNVTIATKFGRRQREQSATIADFIRISAENSLRRLKTDYIDLYQLHSYRDLSPIDEVAEAMERLVASGEVRYFGCGHASNEELRHLLGLCSPRILASCQAECNVLQPQGLRARASLFEEYHLTLLPCIALGAGVLSGKYLAGDTPSPASRLGSSSGAQGRYWTPRARNLVLRLSEFANSRGKTLLELSLGWLLAHSFVKTVIVGASCAEQIVQNCGGTTWVLDGNDLLEIERVIEKQ